ncbi:MAG TPA: putative metallopeptidase [Pyrinomonadaceae bacterium]|nr:putative metallopeptidase [Pyrinomonadaceae bacterium]
MPRNEYAPAHEVRLIAEKLIALFHPRLFGCRIEYVFVSEPPKSLNRELAGRARKVSGLYAFLATPFFEGEPEPFFCIEITKPKWDVRPLRWRVALVDHELRHCDYEDEVDDACLVGHDEEEFDDIVERHGAWNEGLERFIDRVVTGDPRKRELVERLLVELEAELKEGNYESAPHEARQQTEKALAHIDLRRSRNRRDQQTCSPV